MSKHNEHTAKLIEEKLKRDFPDMETHISYWEDKKTYIIDHGDTLPSKEIREAVGQKLEGYAKEIEQEPPKRPRGVRIQNDGGIGASTKLTDADTGESIDHIYHVRVIDIDVKDWSRAILWAYAPVMDIVAHAEVVECCPCCGQQKPDLKKLDDNRIKTTINDTDLDLSIDKLKQIQDLQRSTRGNNIYPAEALTAFVEWLQDRYGMAHSYSLDELSYRVDSFSEAQGWKFDQEYYDEVIGRVRANYPE
jgi:hypothetical protein